MNLSPLPIQKFFDNNGKPLVGGLLFTYAAGTTTKIATAKDQAGTLNTNPIVLDYRGEANVWLDQTLTYKFVLAPAGDTDPPTKAIWTVDNISAAVTYASLTAAIIGQILYPHTAGEIAASVTPTNYQWSPYPIVELDRYGVSANGVTNDTAKIQSAIDSAVTGTVIDGRGRSFGATQLNVNKRITLRGINLVMLNASGATSQQAGFNVSANDVVVDNCGCSITPAGLTNVTNASGVFATGVSGLRIKGGKWDGSKQNAIDYAANIFGSPIQVNLSSNVIVDGAVVTNSDAEGLYLWTCTKSEVINSSVTTAAYSGISIDLGTGNKCIDNVIDTTTASGLSFNSPVGLVCGNLVLNAQTNGINLGHVPGYPVDDTICEANTISNYGISTTNPNGFGGINVQGGNRVKVRNNLIKASFNNTASSKFNHGIQLGSIPVSVEVVGNTIDLAYGYGVRSTDSTDVQLATICDNTITNPWFDGVVVVGCSRAKISGNRIFQPNRANDANSWGISVTRSGVADPLTLDFENNLIVDLSTQMRHGINVYSLGATATIQNVRGNTIRGALTSPLNTSGGWRYNQSGNDFAGGARSGSVTLAAAATSTVVNTGECNTKTAPIVIPGNSQAAALSIWVGSPSAGSFTIGSAAALGTELVQWIIP